MQARTAAKTPTASPQALVKRPAPAGRVPFRRLGLYMFGGVVIAFLLLPTMLIVPMSFGPEKYLEFPPRALSLRWYLEYFRDPEWIRPTLFSFRIALLTAGAATTLGTAAALALVRGRVPGREWVNAAILAPMIVPTIIKAIAVYAVFVRLHLAGTTAGFVLAHTVLAIPYVVLTVSAALYRFDPSLEMAALSLGASRLKAVLRVTLPLVLPAVLTGMAFAFITSFDEAVVSFFISGVRDKTLPRKLFEDIDFDVTPVVAAVATLLTALSFVALGSIELARLRAAARAERTPVKEAGRSTSQGTQRGHQR